MQMKHNEVDIKEALALVDWFLQLAVRRSPRRWSMEQVANPRVIEILSTLKRTNRNVDYLVVDFADLQLPQHRQRLIAGPPWLIDNLRAFKSPARRVPLGRVIHTMPADAKYIRNSVVNYTRGPKSGARMPKRKSMRRVTRPSFTVVCSIALRWYDKYQNCIRDMSPDEAKVVQGFPDWYRFPHGMPNRMRLRGVGNSLPPSVFALALGKAPSPPPAVREGERGACPSSEDTDDEIDKIQQNCVVMDLQEGLRRGSPSLC